MEIWAKAHPNIALIKYWGKVQGPGNLPATPSLSITLDTLETRTRIRLATQDQFLLNDKPQAGTRISNWLSELRAEYAIPPLEIASWNNFPTAAGLASSASGFAALITAIDGALGLKFDDALRSEWARRGSGSAARSIFGGFACLEGPNWQARPLLPIAEWPLKIVVAVIDSSTKKHSSSAGMIASRQAAYFDSWVASTARDYRQAVAAIQSHDFSALAHLAELSCLKMHGLMLATPPGLIYWKPATLAVIEAVRELQKESVPVFFTIDAGPQVKAVCLPEAAQTVAQRLTRIAGVEQVLVAGPGPGAHCFTP